MLNWYNNLVNTLNTQRYVFYIKTRYPLLKLGSNLKIFGKLFISIHKDSKVIFGNGIVFRSSTKYNFVGIYKPASILVAEKAELLIGHHSGFSGTSIFASKKIIIGSYCNFGGNTAVWDTDFHPLEYQARRIHDVSQIKNAPIIIGNDVFVGANSIILKGVTIGDRSIIGAGSVVSKNIPSDEIWAGNPVRFIRKITNEI